MKTKEQEIRYYVANHHLGYLWENTVMDAIKEWKNLWDINNISVIYQHKNIQYFIEDVIRKYGIKMQNTIYFHAVTRQLSHYVVTNKCYHCEQLYPKDNFFDEVKLHYSFELDKYNKKYVRDLDGSDIKVYHEECWNEMEMVKNRTKVLTKIINKNVCK